MRYAVIAILLLASCFAQSRNTTKAATQPQDIGRYQIFFSPNVRADTFLVDTQTGKIWRMQQFTDVPGQPTVWAPEKKFDTDEDFNAWIQKALQLKEWVAQGKGQQNKNDGSAATPTSH